MRVQHPVGHYLLDFYLEVLLEEVDERERLRVEGLVVEHDLDKSETVLCLFSDFELSLAEPALHEALKVVDLEGLAVLLVGEVEEADYRSLLTAAPHEALGDLVYLQVYALLVLVLAEGQHLVVHPSVFH